MHIAEVIETLVTGGAFDPYGARCLPAGESTGADAIVLASLGDPDISHGSYYLLGISARHLKRMSAFVKRTQ